MSENTTPTQARRPRRWRWALAILALALGAVIIIHLLRGKPPARGAAPQVVTVATAITGSMPETINALGTVTPVATVTVLPQLSGYLTAVGYKEGQDVEKGQFLAQIDPRQYEIGKQQAEAQLAKDRAALAQGRADLARYADLHARKSIAEQTYEDQQFLVRQQEAAVQADQANIAQFVLDLAYCRITAPVSGRVGLRLVDPGNYVTASSQPGIAVITTMKPTTVQFNVPQNALADVLQHFRGGARLAVTAYSSDNVHILATGSLYAIGNQMATSTGTVPLRATFANDDEALFPNAFVNVRMLVDTLQNVVLVPTPAVQSGAPGDYVYFVNADQTVAVRKVTLGPGDGQHTVVTAGLKVGDVVVTSGTDRLSDGAKIKVAPPPQKAGGASGAAAATPPPTGAGGASHVHAAPTASRPQAP